MSKKLIVLLLFVSLCITQAMFFAPRQQAAQNTELTELATMLPESDVIVTMDFNRAMNIAAPKILNDDASKIGNFKNLMRTLENNIGIDPYEIKQIVAGANLPSDLSKKFPEGFEFTAIVRTTNANGNLIDNWSKRIDVISAFEREKSPTRRYMNEFRMFRDFKNERVTPEKISEATTKIQSALDKTTQINTSLNALPKRPAITKDAGYVRKNNQDFIAGLKRLQEILKAETDMKDLRSTSIKLLNRWNAVTLDDAQKSAKLAAIFNESKAIYPAYKKKYDNAKKLEALFNYIEPNADFESESKPLFDEINAQLDDALGKIKTREIYASSKVLEEADANLNSKIEALNTVFDAGIIDEDFKSDAANNEKSKSFQDAFKQAKREENINGKRMMLIDPAKFDNPASIDKDAPKIPNLAVGFVDDKTMVVGFENSVSAFLKRDAGYKNTKALEMLNNSSNSLAAFAMSSNAIKKLLTDNPNAADNFARAEIFGFSLVNDFVKEMNIYGSINFDETGNLTNDISMSLGFIKNSLTTTETSKPVSKTNPNDDNSFEIAGFQVGKDIFYDLLGSFKAMQASMTFKFEKKKVVALMRNTPKIIDRIRAENREPKKSVASNFKAKPRKLGDIQDLLTSPQLYIDLAKILGRES